MTIDIKKIVLFTERNSPYSVPLIQEIGRRADQFTLTAIITRAPGVLCKYYLQDKPMVDIIAEARSVNPDIKAIETEQLRPHFQDILDLGADIFLVANYGVIIPQAIFDIPALAINFHAGPPSYSGVEPFFWMARRGERKGGVMAHQVTSVVDAGPILHRVEVELTGEETTREVRDKLFDASATRLFPEALDLLSKPQVELTPQNPEERTYYGRRTLESRVVNVGDELELQRALRAWWPEPVSVRKRDGSTVEVTSDGRLPKGYLRAGCN